MKNLFKLSALVLSGILLFVGCDGQYDSLVDEQKDENPLPPGATYSSGSADFTNFISIGNSQTAGFMDAALYNEGQANSVGNLLAQSLSQAVEGGISYNQPEINSVNGFNTSIPSNLAGQTTLGRFKLDVNIPGPSPVVNGDAIGAYSGNVNELNNYGIPGITVGQLLIPETAIPNNPAFSPFYARIATDPGTSTILGDVVARQPTFFSLWIGNNDVLGYAVGGASNPAILTSPGDFTTRFGAVISTLMNNTSADGIVADIPFFLGLAYFQAVTWDNIGLDEATATFLNQNLAPVNGAIQGCANFGVDQADIDRRLISYSAGDNPILAIDEELDDLGGCFDNLLTFGQIDAQQRAALVPYEQSRPLVQGELVLLGAGSVLGTEADGDASVADTPIGVVVPLGFNIANGSLSGDRYYLTQAEQVEIETARQTFNAIIANTIAGNNRIAYYNTNDANSVFGDIFGLTDGQPGISVDGVDLAPDFSPNGVLSTDGVHANPRGNAILTNEFIRVIENSFGATLPRVDVLNLQSVELCAGDCVSQQSGS
ncbi:hypothetical protein AB2B38_003755 [Balneola sp. MJW-20]|uniref:hypothetical protein n=1 Tax=Gracilimonas aurantiaca TaxID=3234185 RepID=UPI003465805B